MASSSPGASLSSNSSASSRAALAKLKPAAASRRSFPSRINCVSPPRKSPVPGLTMSPAARSKLSRPGFAVRRHEPKSVIPSEARNLSSIFLILLTSTGSEGTTAMTAVNTSHRARIILGALVLLLGAFWAGARFGPRQPTNVEALPLGGSSTAKTVSQRDPALTNDQSINVRVYRQTSPAVGNILTQGTPDDFFIDPVPVEGAGSGFVI